jgi:polysaccharide export outer membrane protein
VSGKVKPLFVNRTTTDEPVLASVGCEGCRSASLLRPVPASCNCAGCDGPWGVAKPTACGTPSTSGEMRSAATIEPPQPAPPLLQPVRGEGDTALTPIPVGSSDPPAGGDSSRTNAAPPARPVESLPRPAETLPPPRSLASTKLPQGYPELPPVGITHPVEAPRELDKRALSAYVIEPPDILAIEGIAALSDERLPITGPHLVRPDGTIGLGVVGSIFVAGMTVDQAKLQIAQAILASRGDQAKVPEKNRLTLKNILEGLKVDVAAYNSKFYYVITDGGGFGEQVIRLPCTGNEMVLDAIAQIQGLPSVASKKHIWVARATPDHAGPQILPVDWCGIAQRGSAATNYQLYPGDRIYVNSDPFIRTDSKLQKILAPIERLLGATLLGSSVVNSIKNGSNSGAGGTGSAFR